MALKVLSGIIIPRDGFRHRGTATIDFHPHEIHSDQIERTRSEDKETIGPDGPFSSEPCRVVSLRHIRFSDLDHSRPSEAVNADRKDFNINDDFDETRRNSLTVSWRTDGEGAEIREISYLIFGPTLDLEPIDVHFVVLADPAKSPIIPTPTSTHTHPLTGQLIAGPDYFQAEIDLINSVFVDEFGNPICIDDDCLQFRYHSHTFYNDFINTSCSDFLNISQPPDSSWTESNPHFNDRLADAVNNCNDTNIVEPNAINFFIYDACDWPQGGQINWLRTVGHGRRNGNLPYAFVDYTRMFNPNRQAVRAAEEHELGHALGMTHTTNPPDNTMGHNNRDAFYRTVTTSDGTEMNQHERMVNTARRHQRRWNRLD